MKKRTLNKLFSISLTAAMALGMLSGCGNTASNTGTASPAETGTATTESTDTASSATKHQSAFTELPSIRLLLLPMKSKKYRMPSTTTSQTKSMLKSQSQILQVANTVTKQISRCPTTK